MERVSYRARPECARLSNGIVDLIVTTDVGPRIARFGFEGERNEFGEVDGLAGSVGDEGWHPYGGHRFWHAPEEKPRTYLPDNAPVEVEDHSAFVRFRQPVEAMSAIQKELDIALLPGKAQVRVTHRLRNCGLWTVELAPWGLSMMAAGGTAILPLQPEGIDPDGLLPTGAAVFWPYSDPSAPSLLWGRRYVLLRQPLVRGGPQKVGARSENGWAAYARDGHLFVKGFQFLPGATYPDMGCTIESYANEGMLELETLGPLAPLAPGATVEHIETWALLRDVPTPTSEAEVERDVLPRVKEIQG